MEQNKAILPEAFFRLSYGLYLLSVNRNGANNACIINTAIQVTDTPKRILFAVNKENLTALMLRVGGVCNLSALSESAPFELIRQYGFQSGRDTDKFAGQEVLRASNGTLYPAAHVSALICATVVNAIDVGTHTVFIADVTEATVPCNEPPMSYAYYHAHVKPQKPAASAKKGYVCKVCGYVYEGDPLPDDFICPLCKHGASDFEPLS